MSKKNHNLKNALWMILLLKKAKSAVSRKPLSSHETTFSATFSNTTLLSIKTKCHQTRKRFGNSKKTIERHLMKNLYELAATEITFWCITTSTLCPWLHGYYKKLDFNTMALIFFLLRETSGTHFLIWRN